MMTESFLIHFIIVAEHRRCFHSLAVYPIVKRDTTNIIRYSILFFVDLVIS